MRLNEMVAFAPLVVLAIVMGVYPALFLDPMDASVEPAPGPDRAPPAPTWPQR